MGGIPTRRRGGHCLDTDSVGMAVMMTDVIMPLIGIVLISAIMVLMT